MDSKLLVFNGGLQTKLSEHLIQDNQAVECLNVDLSKGSIYPFNEWIEPYAVTGRHVYNVDADNAVSNSHVDDIRSYATFGNRVYFTNKDYTGNNYGLLRIDSTYNVVNATAPNVTSYGSITLTATGAAELVGDYAYVYTVVDTDGIESAPSLPQFISAVSNTAVQVDIGTDTVNETVASRRIYRTGGNNPTYNLIAEIDDPTVTYTDTTRDIDVSRIELTTFADYAPPVGLDNLVENNGTFWASVGNKVYFSRSGQPEFWGKLDYVVLNEDCTGLGKFRDVVVAFTDSEAYVISGYNRDTISLEKLPFQEGCTDHHNITNVGELLVWTSKNGICAYNGSDVQVITENILSWEYNQSVGNFAFDDINSSFDSVVGLRAVYAASVRGRYYAVFQNGISVVDFTLGGAVSSLELENIVSCHYNKFENTLDAVTLDDDGGYTCYSFNIDETTKTLARWKTGAIQVEGHNRMKDFRKVSLDDIPSYVKVSIDGKQVINAHNRKDFHLPAGSIGRTIQFEIGTKKEIKSLEFSYGTLR